MSYPQSVPLEKKQRSKKAGTNKQVHISHLPINHQQQQPLLLKLVFVHSSSPPHQALAAARPSDPRHFSPTCFLARSTPDQRSSRSVLRQLSSVPTLLSARLSSHFQYLQAKNINYDEPANNIRILAMVASNLKHNAYAWYRIHKDSITDVQELMAGITREFVPPDLQERLRDQLYSLHQRKCPSLEDYISRFCSAIMQVKQISEFNKTTYFIRGLVSTTKEEIQYCRCQTVSHAIAIALDYDRAHPSYSGSRDRQLFRPHHSNRSQHRPQQQYAPLHRFAPRQDFRRDNMPEPMEIDSRKVSTPHSAVNRKTYTYCKKLRHLIDECFKKKNRDAQKSTRGPSSTFRRNFYEASNSVNYFEVDDKAEDVNINTFEVHEASSSEDLPTVTERPENELVRKNGLCDGKEDIIILTPVLL